MSDPAKQLGQMFIDAIDMDRAVDALMLDETKCHICGLQLDPGQTDDGEGGHPECREEQS